MRPALVSLVTRWLCIGPSWTNTLVRDSRAVTSASLAESPPQNMPSSPISNTPAAAPTNDSLASTPDLAPLQMKHPRTQPVLCDQPIDNDTDLTKVLDNASEPKKAKMTPDQLAIGLQADISIILIDDVKDLQNKQLNKNDPTTNIKEFFTALPAVPGHGKGHVLCKLCR